MAKFRLSPPPQPSPQSEPLPGQPGEDAQAGLPMHMKRPRPLPAGVQPVPGGVPETYQSPEEWEAQYDRPKMARVVGDIRDSALAYDEAQAEVARAANRQAIAPAPGPELGAMGRVAEGFEAVGRGGLAGLASGIQALRAPFYATGGDAPRPPNPAMYGGLSGGYIPPGVQQAFEQEDMLARQQPSAPRVVDDPIGAGYGRFADEQRQVIAGMQSPASQVAGAGADIVGGMVPYLHPLTGATAGAGNALIQGKSGLGVATNAALGAVPGAAGSAVSRGLGALMGRAGAPIVTDTLAQAGLGAGMAAGTALETQLFEDMPELAAQEWGMVAPTAGGLGALGAVGSLMTRGRGAFRAPGARPDVVPGAQRETGLEPIEGGPATGPSPFAPEMASPGMFGDGPGQSPFGGEFQTAPRPDIQPEMRASTVSADPVLTGPDGRPALPDVLPGEFVQTGQRQTLGPDGLPLGARGEFVQTGAAPRLDADGLPIGRPGEYVEAGRYPLTDEAGLPAGQRGEFVAAPEARTGVDGRPLNLPGEVEGRAMHEADGFYEIESPAMMSQGFNRIDSPAPRPDGFFRTEQAPPTPEGFYRARPRRPDIQPQRNDPTSLGEAPIRDPIAEYRQRGIDPNAETRIGEDYLDVPDADFLPPARPLPGGSIRGNNTPATDPFGDVEGRVRGGRYDTTTQEDLQAIRGEPIDIDQTAAPTELQLDPVPGRSQRAEMATEPEMAPFKPGARDRRPDLRAEFTSATTLRDAPIVSPKPGLAHLSPEAQAFVAGVKPGERELLADSIAYFKQNPDPAGDTGNLKMVLDMARAKRERKPGARPKLSAPGEGAAPEPRPFSTRAEAGLVQGGFRRAGEATPKAVDVNAPTERIVRPVTAPEVQRHAEVQRNGDSGTPAVPSREVPRAKPESPASVKGEGPVDHINYGGIPTEGLHAAARGIGGALQLGGSVAKKGLDAWAKRLYKVVGDLPGGKPAAEKAQKVIDRTREFMGKFDGDRQRFLKEVHGNGPKSRAARRSFAEVQWDGDVGFSRLNDILDGAADARPYEKPAINAFRSAFLGTGKLAETLPRADGGVGYQIAVGGKLVPFKADPKRLRSPRIGTDALHWYSDRPNHPETKRLASEIAKLNPGMTPEQVMRELDFWTERGVSKRGMAEEARTIENFPTHYRNSDGRVIQLLSDDPVRVIDAVTRRFPARMAYVTEFGQGSIPKELAALGKPGEAAAKNLFRALNGMPLDPPVGLDNAPPGSAQSDAMGWINIPWTGLKGLKLSMAPLANLPETMGKGRSIAGSNPLKLIKAGFDVSWMNRNSDAIIDDLANRGAMTRDVMDWYWNKSDLPDTLNRYTLNTTGYVNQFVNEFNEKMIARLSDQWTKALKAGKGGMVDRFRLKLLEFKPGEIDAIMAGKASPQTYNNVLGRAVEWAQGSTSQPAERSRAAGTRWWNWATIADRFAQMNINRNFGVWAKVGETLADGNSTWKDRLGAVTFAADLAGGQVAAAATTLMLRAMVVGGGAVLTDKAFGSPLGLQDFLLDATKYALLGGPVQAIIQGATQERGEGLGESLANMALPVSTTQDIVDAFAGRGQYEGMTGVEAAGKLLKSSTPITGVGANIAAVTGLSQDNPALDAGISAFWKWRHKYAPTPRVEGGGAADEETAKFRGAMRKAGLAMRDGADPSEAVNAALEVKSPKTVAQSLRARKLLKSLKPEQLAAVTEYLGDETVSRLHAYDELLETWAQVVSPKKR